MASFLLGAIPDFKAIWASCPVALTLYFEYQMHLSPQFVYLYVYTHLCSANTFADIDYSVTLRSV